MVALLASTSLSHSFSEFFDAVGSFFSDLAAVHWGALLLGALFFVLNLTLRSRAIFNSMRAAYPRARIQWRRIWGAYFAAVGFNNVVPARGGDVIKLFLAKSSIPDSTYATVAASIYTEAPFDITLSVIILIFAFTQGVFPKPPDFAKLDAFDLSFLASNFRLTLFLITLVGVAGIVAFAFLSRRVVAFWARLQQGLTILRDRRRYLRQVIFFQVLAWFSRAAAFWCFLDAFRIGGSVRNVMLVFAINSVAGLIPLAPGGVGIQQALYVKVFKHATQIVAYSVGQQIVIAVLTAGIGLFSVLFIFRFRSFKEVIHAGRADRAQEKRPRRDDGGEDEPERPTEARSGPRERV
ncbi:MAG TPA: lysylphosphatidylglycerol synthase transmembrane domain-containing protein [Solirubrobacteraceae bacterium]